MKKKREGERVQRSSLVAVSKEYLCLSISLLRRCQVILLEAEHDCVICNTLMLFTLNLSGENLLLNERVKMVMFTCYTGH